MDTNKHHQAPLGTIYIGIDPDTDKNGVAILDVTTRKVVVKQLKFAETINYIRRCFEEYATKQKKQFKVIIEAGWLNKGNWHLNRWDNRAASAAKGVDQGRNEQTSRLLGEMMEYFKIPFLFKRPLPKCWRGANKKITKEEIEQVMQQPLGRINQEGRDAALLAWHEAKLPIKLDISKLEKKREPTKRQTTKKNNSTGKVVIFKE